MKKPTDRFNGPNFACQTNKLWTNFHTACKVNHRDVLTLTLCFKVYNKLRYKERISGMPNGMS